MKEERIYQICIVLAAIGIGLIYSSSIYLEPEETEINRIERSQQGQKVLVSGNVTGFYTAKGHTFFEVKDSTASIEIAEFNNERELENGTSVEVEGRVSMYEGRVQVVADEVNELDQE